MDMLGWLAAGIFLGWLWKKSEKWSPMVSGKDFALMKKDITSPGTIFSLHPFKREFKKGEKYRITDKDWLGRDLWELEYSDHWVSPEDFELVKG